MNLILSEMKNNIISVSSSNNSGCFSKQTSSIDNVFNIIYSYFSSLDPSVDILISKPTLSFTNKKVTIELFYYAPASAKLDKNFISILSQCLSRFYDKEVKLTIIQVHYPYINSYILAQYLCHNAPSNTFLNFQDSILSYPSRAKMTSGFPAYVSGIKIQVSGRMITERIVPRITIKSALFGSFKKNSSTFTDYSKFTSKNELGAFTVKVWIAQRNSILDLYTIFPFLR